VIPYPQVQAKPKGCLRHPERTTGPCEHLCNLPAGDRRLNCRFRELKFLIPERRKKKEERRKKKEERRKKRAFIGGALRHSLLPKGLTL